MKMVPCYWHFASILVFIISSSVVFTDTLTCESSDQHCLITPKTDALTQQKDLDKERQQLARETNRQERSERDNDRHWDHRHTKFLTHTNRDSRRLYDRIRDVKKSSLNQRNLDNIRESRRLRGNRRYLAGERLSDLHSIEIDSSEQGTMRPDTLRERLLHRFALTASENGYLTARAQRRFARFHDDIENARMTTRFERLQKSRMAHLSRGDDENDGVRVVSRFERTRNDKMARLSKSDTNLRIASETDRSLPHHFQNLKRVRESIDRRESGFERRNAYATIIRNQVRVSDDAVKAGDDKAESRFEVQRKHRQELEEELRKESIEGKNTGEEEGFMENRRMRKEQRREIEERMIREEKQRLLDEERKIREETERIRESERKMRETERRIKEILREIRENERKAREERQRKLNEEKRLRQSVSDRERDNDKWHENEKIRFNSEERIRDDDKFIRQHELEDYYGERPVFDYSHEDWDYSDYSDSASSESYEDDWELERRLREDIRLFPDIQRQIRENVQLYGREVLDAKETISNEKNDETLKDVEHRVDHKEHRADKREEIEDNNNRRKRSLDTIDRRFRHSSEVNANKEKRQIAERRSFRSQDERLIRRVNLRRMNEMRQNERSNIILQRRMSSGRIENSENSRFELNRKGRIELQKNERSFEHNDRIEPLENRRRELQRNERNREHNDRIEITLQRQENNQRTENSRERDNELRKNVRNIERQTEITLKNQEAQRFVKHLNDRRIHTDEQEVRTNRDNRRINSHTERLKSEKDNERDIRIRLERQEDRRLIQVQDQIREIVSKDFQRQIHKASITQSNEFFTSKPKEYMMYDNVNVASLLQAALIGIVLINLIRKQEFSEKKFR